ncbi:Phospho-2-dehydro-3-deoxyheptonate aldolase [Clostridioides difficile]|nr:Phospho-2-dehydro-3-deoxyheptonate aldolase [Clostridioides difficile]
MVEPLAKAAIAIGADGLIIEVHNDPANALCDGPQSIKPEKYARIFEELKVIAKAVGREM